MDPKQQKIVPCLWFDGRAEEAVSLYVSVFKNSRIIYVSRYGEAGAEVSGQQKGTVMTIDFELEGQMFMAMNGGPQFTFSPAVSFFVNCATREEIDRLWDRLSVGGMALMELGRHPFSERYGWLSDRFGVSWQLNLAGREQKIAPTLMFVGEQHGKAEQAINSYMPMFEGSKMIKIERYGKGEQGAEGSVKHAIFSLGGQELMALDAGLGHRFTFTPAISFLVNCDTQDEVDRLWETLTKGGNAEQCGWLKDRYGVSWQIVPTILGEFMQDEDAGRRERVMNAMLKMVKIDIRLLKQAYQA